MTSTILILACMVALVVSAPNTMGNNKQADEASPFAQLTTAQRTCVMDQVKADPSILVSTLGTYICEYILINMQSKQNPFSFWIYRQSPIFSPIT